MRLSLVTGPAVEPLALADARSHLRVVGTQDDNDISTYIVAARRWAENYTSRALITQTWKVQFDGSFPGFPVELPMPNLQSVSAIRYYDAAGAQQVWAPANYVVDAPAGPQAPPGRVDLATSVSVPAVLSRMGSVEIEFVAGYGSDVDTIPGDLVSAMKLVLGHLFENREDVVIAPGLVAIQVPKAAEYLAAGYRW